MILYHGGAVAIAAPDLLQFCFRTQAALDMLHFTGSEQI